MRPLLLATAMEQHITDECGSGSWMSCTAEAALAAACRDVVRYVPNRHQALCAIINLHCLKPEASVEYHAMYGSDRDLFLEHGIRYMSYDTVHQSLGDLRVSSCACQEYIC